MVKEDGSSFVAGLKVEQGGCKTMAIAKPFEPKEERVGWLMLVRAFGRPMVDLGCYCCTMELPKDFC